MSAPIVRLEADGISALILDPFAGYVIQQLDIGDAVTREVMENSPDADGTDDTTSFVGARTVTMSIKLVPPAGSTKEQMRQRLRAFTSPRLRPIMYVTLDVEDEQRIVLRRSQWSNVVANPAYADVLVQWIAPLGILESASLHEQIVSASGGGLVSGLSFPWSFDLDFGDADPIGSATVTNAGTADAYPLLRIYGPCTDPSIENVTQGKTIVFEGLTVLAGEFVEIDVRAKTIYYLGDSTDSRYDDLDFPASAWWTLSPGDNEITFGPATYSPPAQCQFVFRDAWL